MTDQENRAKAKARKGEHAMKRNEFKKIIKIRSEWQFTGDNYKLPSGEPISVYVRKLVESQMNVDNLAILKMGICLLRPEESGTTQQKSLKVMY